MKWLLACAAVVVAGCASTPARVVETRLPVPVPCVAQAPDLPALMPAEKMLRLDDFDLVLEIERQRRALLAWATVAHAMLRACEGDGRL